MRSYDLSTFKWVLRGYTPYQWAWGRSMETGVAQVSEIPEIPACVPGSVQAALRKAGLLPDWNMGLNARACEWIENRHWMFETALPEDLSAPATSRTGKDDATAAVRLRCEGLDGSGWVLVNGREVGTFANTFVPHVFDLTHAMREHSNRLQILFDCPPRWLGQFGYTSRITDWKPRFNYTWDWCPRMVQTGIWDAVILEVGPPRSLADARCQAAGTALRVWTCGQHARLTLADSEGRVLRTGEFRGEVVWENLPVQPWWPNGSGPQPLYTVRCECPDSGESRCWRVGFKIVEWRPCHGAPAGADPWLCVINGKPIFLQGVNWTPIRPNFADVTVSEMRKRLLAYRDMGCNVLRVWGGAVLEKESFYDICDELGLMVWQEFPLSSSGLDNWPPESPQAVEDMARIAASYIARRQHHACLLCWCGGNELQGSLDGGKVGTGKPVGKDHPMMARLRQVVADMDPGRRFLETSPCGPRFVASSDDFGKGLHWEVHGPWTPESEQYWSRDDALFRSEVGAPGPSSAPLIREFSAGLSCLPASLDNPLWRRTAWWIQWPQFIAENGREPLSLEEFVAWGQRRQAEALTIALSRCKARFPACGGVIIWMAHDAFPCAANTSLLDFNGDRKPAAEAVARLFLAPAAELGQKPDAPPQR